jgi:hypothetical protein
MCCFQDFQSEEDMQQRHWYNDRELFIHGLARSNYITAFTDWFMGLAGKATELVLYATVLYSCAQLYPGVSLPANVSLAVFLIQMGALDIGGLSLGKLAKQAREDGNPQGADRAATLSKWLIGIMLAGVITVGVEHVIPLGDQIQTGVQLVLVVGRSFCAVLYGRVVHDLKTDSTSQKASELTSLLTEMFSHELTLAMEQTRQEFTAQLAELSGELTGARHNQGELLASLSETLATHERTLVGQLAMA